MSEASEADKPLTSMQMLDTLIKEYYAALTGNVKSNGKKNGKSNGKKNGKKDVKVGDFLKMIELRRKLAPVDADQREFWNMLEKVRKEVMNDQKKRTTRKKKPVRSSDAKGR